MQEEVGSQFHSDYGPVLRGTLFAFDRDPRGHPHTRPDMTTWDVLTGSATV